MANIKKIYQYPLLEKREQHITGAANKLIKDNLGIDVKENPEIQIDESLVRETSEKLLMKTNELNILLAIGGSGPTKRIPARTFLAFMKKIKMLKNVNFFLPLVKMKMNKKF